MTKGLPELLVSLALGALVIAGALQMHTALSRQARRQEEVGETQQTLRLSLRLLESALRAAGAGGPVVENDEGQCPGGPRTHPPIAWAEGTLRLLGTRAAAPMTVEGEGGGELQVVAGSARELAALEWVQVLTPDGVCARQITAVDGERLAHDPAHATSCFDPAPATDRCLARCTRAAPCPLRRLGASEFRVEGHRLVMRTAAPDGAARPWTPIADDVEALKVEPLCRGAAGCEVAAAQALRVTLVARGRSLSTVIALRN